MRRVTCETPLWQIVIEQADETAEPSVRLAAGFDGFYETEDAWEDEGLDGIRELSHLITDVLVGFIEGPFQ